GIVRIVEGLSGCVEVESELVVRFGYGRVGPRLSRAQDAIVAPAGPDALVMRTPAATSGENMTTVSTFEVRAGERMPFAVTLSPAYSELPSFVDPDEALRETEKFWTAWASRCTYGGPSR